MPGVCGAEYQDTSHVKNVPRGAKLIRDVWDTLLSKLNQQPIIVPLSPRGMKPQNVQAVVVATLSKLREDALRNVLRSERTSTSQETI